MILRHLLLGLGGSVAIGGIGYGIYSSSQYSEEEGIKTSVQEQGQKESQNSDGATDEEKSDGEAQPTDDPGKTRSTNTGDDQATRAPATIQTNPTPGNGDQGTIPQPATSSKAEKTIEK